MLNIGPEQIERSGGVTEYWSTGVATLLTAYCLPSSVTNNLSPFTNHTPPHGPFLPTPGGQAP